MLDRMLLLCTILCLSACSNSGTQAGHAEQTDAQPAQAEPDSELVSVASRPASSGPAFLLDSYGLESGEIGIKECDALVKLMTECSRSLESGGGALMADTKQQRLAWKLAARQAAGDPARLRIIARECQAAESAALAKMKAAGCGSASEQHKR